MPALPSQNGRADEPRLAINLFDLDRLDPTIRSGLLKGRLDMKPFKTDWDRVGGGIQEVALIFVCPLLEAAIICDTIRNGDRLAGDFPTRLYLKRKAWSRVPSYRILTVINAAGRCELNPELFKVEVEKAEAVPLQPRRILLGKKT